MNHLLLKHYNRMQLGCGSRNCMGGIEDSIDPKLKGITSCLSPNFFMWWMMAMSQNLLLCLKTCIVWFATLFPKFIVVLVPLKRGNVWFHITNNMKIINNFMKKHNLAKHPCIWCRWKNVNSVHVAKEQC